MSDYETLGRSIVCCVCDNSVEGKAYYPIGQQYLCYDCGQKPKQVHCRCCKNVLKQIDKMVIRENQIYCSECCGDYQFWAVQTYLRGINFFETQIQAIDFIKENWEKCEFDCYYTFASPFNFEELTGENIKTYGTDLFLAYENQVTENGLLILKVTKIKQ